LKDVLSIIFENLRLADTVARIGVAKLAFLTPSTNRIGARQFAERIRNQTEALCVEFGGISLPITISTGIAAIDIVRDTSLDDILKIANQHLNDAINSGGNCVVLEEISETDITEAEADAETIIIQPLPEEPDLETAVQLCQ